jgi:hypothetical protein
MNNLLIMCSPVTKGERFEFKRLASMAKKAGFALRVAERRSIGDSLVSYKHINERHKEAVDEALASDSVNVYVVNGMADIVSRGAIELCTIDNSPLEKLAKIVGATLSRQDKICTALLASDAERSIKLHELRATHEEIRSATRYMASY